MCSCHVSGFQQPFWDIHHDNLYQAVGFKIYHQENVSLSWDIYGFYRWHILTFLNFRISDWNILVLPSSQKLDVRCP